MNTNQYGKQGNSQGSLWPLPSSRVTKKTLKVRDGVAGLMNPWRLCWVRHLGQGRPGPQQHDDFLGGGAPANASTKYHFGWNEINSLSLNKESSLHSQKPRVRPGYSQPTLGHLLPGGVAWWRRDRHLLFHLSWLTVPLTSQKPTLPPKQKTLCYRIEPSKLLLPQILVPLFSNNAWIYFSNQNTDFISKDFLDPTGFQLVTPNFLFNLCT